MKEYIELLERMAEELNKVSVLKWELSKEDAMRIIRKFLNPFDPKPQDNFNPMK